MNLSETPSKEELKRLISEYDDKKACHIIWVDNDGNVNLTPLPENLSPAGWVTENREIIKFRFETLDSGNGYVGVEASNDNVWIERLFRGLVTHWEKDSKGYFDNF